MAVGDAAVGSSQVTAGSVLDIQPSGTVEYIIHNIFHDYDIELQWYDGTNAIVTNSIAGAGVVTGPFHCTNAKRLRVKNTHGSVTKGIGYDGIVTHA